MGTNGGRQVGRAFAPWLVAASAYLPIRHHAGPILEGIGKTAYEVNRGVQWIRHEIPDRIRDLIGEKTDLDELVWGLEHIGVDREAIGAFESSYRTKNTISNYLDSAITASAKTTMDLNESIERSAPWMEPFVRYTSALRNRTSGDTADAYQAFIDELRAFDQAANDLPSTIGSSITNGNAQRAEQLISEYVSIACTVSEQGNRFHDAIGEDLITLQDELRSELGDERYEQLRRYNERERDRWGDIAAAIGSAAAAGAGAFALRKPARFVGGAAGSTLAYFGKRLRKDQEREEPELKWS